MMLTSATVWDPYVKEHAKGLVRSSRDAKMRLLEQQLSPSQAIITVQEAETLLEAWIQKNASAQDSNPSLEKGLLNSFLNTQLALLSYERYDIENPGEARLRLEAREKRRAALGL